MTGEDAWRAGLRSLAALAVDPAGLGGLHIRARAGPVRDAFEALCRQIFPSLRRISPDFPEDQVFGGVDVLASLQEGRLVRQPGLTGQPCALLLTGAERANARFAAQLAALLDLGRGQNLILLDEGVDDDERAPAALRERCAFSAEFASVPWAIAKDHIADKWSILSANARYRDVRVKTEQATALTVTALRLGIDSLRAPILALRAARALAALDDRTETSDGDIREAAELVFAHRATRLPEPDDQPPENEPAPDQAEPGEGDDQDRGKAQRALEDMVLDAVTARLPADVLDRMTQGKTKKGSGAGSGSGARRRSARRGRPLPARPGRPDGQARVDIIATLRAAAPFQRMRQSVARERPGVVIHPSDLRVRRYETHSDRLLVFAVDASGSSALARMAEAKGAVELLLAQGYAARDHVALVAFRGTAAEVLLQPTRSLVQAKRRLAALPGGGGTPLASGLLAASQMMTQGAHHGLSPSVIVLTDGRGNIALDGEADRTAARKDAETVARHMARSPGPALVIDTSARPATESAELAGWMGATYLPLPRADAARISRAADAALSA